MRLKVLAILGTSVLVGCQTTTVISDYCQSYRIIRPSRADTSGTLQQVATENAKWRSVCEVKK